MRDLRHRIHRDSSHTVGITDYMDKHFNCQKIKFNWHQLNFILGSDIDVDPKVVLYANLSFSNQRSMPEGAKVNLAREIAHRSALSG